MTRILTIVDWYLPGFKAGGALRSVSNMVASLGGGEFEFFVLTRDRDFMDTVPYPGLPVDSWTSVGKAQVLYTANYSLNNLRRHIADIDPDIIYLNSFFSPFTMKAMLLLRLGWLRPQKVIIAPRGELSPGALGIKKAKKRLHLKLAGAAGLFKNVLWHASAPREKEEIERVLSAFRLDRSGRKGAGPSIHVASDIPGEPSVEVAADSLREKRAGDVSFVFVSRVSPIKNLVAAIDLVALIKGRVAFDIYGPAEDTAYWQQCQEAITRAPNNVAIRYLGPIQHEEARKVFLQYHFFLFPTLSENFGHVIVESLSAGCPVILSDQTPWLDMESKTIGWNLPLNDLNRWRQVLQDCADMDAGTYREMSLRAVEFFREWICSPKIRDENVQLFRRALGKTAPEEEESGPRDSASPKHAKAEMP